MTDRFVHISGDVSAESIIVKQQRQEIAQLKEAIRRLADQDATLSVQSGNVTVTMDATLTDAERQAIGVVFYGAIALMIAGILLIGVRLLFWGAV